MGQEKNIRKLRELQEEKIKKRKKKTLTLKIILLLLVVAVVGIFAMPAVKKIINKKTKDSNTNLQTNQPANNASENVINETEEALQTEEVTTEAPNKTTQINLTFVGDCMIASAHGKLDEGCLNWYADNYPTTYFFEKVRDIFLADDFTIANCECVFTDRDLPEREKNWSPVYWFRSKAKNAKVFSDNGIEAVTVENNHLYDYNEEGAADTKAALDAAGVKWGTNDDIIYLEKDGYVISIVCISMYDYSEAEGDLKYLEKAKENSDFQVIYFHGGIEAKYIPEDWKINACHMFIDNGADLVIGAHPHVLQRAEQYNGVDIVYSLGNFCFGGNNAPKNRTIIYQYTLDIVNGEIQAKNSNIIPCYVYTGSKNNWQPAIITDQDKIDRVMKFMAGESDDPN